MLKIGVTGGLGSGKSTATQAFARLGVPVIDTDEISRKLTSAGPALSQLYETFGEAVFAPDGSLDRKALRARILVDDAAKQRLEAILHPMIYAEVVHQLERVQASAPYVLVVVPLLAENAAYRRLVDRVLVVDCSPELQVARALARGGWEEAEIRAMLGKQASREARLALADDVIDNSGSVAALNRQVHALHEKYRKLAGQTL